MGKVAAGAILPERHKLFRFAVIVGNVE